MAGAIGAGIILAGAGACAIGATLEGAIGAGIILAGAGACAIGATFEGATGAGITLAGATGAGITLAGACAIGATFAGATGAGITLAGDWAAGMVFCGVCALATKPMLKKAAETKPNILRSSTVEFSMIHLAQIGSNDHDRVHDHRDSVDPLYGIINCALWEFCEFSDEYIDFFAKTTRLRLI